jgi:hypothetical protein
LRLTPIGQYGSRALALVSALFARVGAPIGQYGP